MAAIAPVSSGGYQPLSQNSPLHATKPDDAMVDYFEKALGPSPDGEDYGKDMATAFNSSFFAQSQHVFTDHKRQMDDIYADLKEPPKNNKKH